MVFLGILGFMDEQRLGWEPPHHGTNSLASNTPAAPRVYRIKFKLLRLEFKTCSTWLQCLILRNMSSLSGPFPFIHAVHWCEKPFPFPSSSLSFLGLTQMPSSHNHSPGYTASSEVWEEEEGMCRPQRPAKNPGDPHILPNFTLTVGRREGWVCNSQFPVYRCGNWVSECTELIQCHTALNGRAGIQTQIWAISTTNKMSRGQEFWVTVPQWFFT